MAFLSSLFGDPNERAVASLHPIVERVNGFGALFEALSDDALGAKTASFKERLAKGETLDDILPEAFAVVREASHRALGLRHFDVQLVGGIVLHRGSIAEMRTGEGKTLVATLPLYLNALTGKGCHLVTPNDYLSRVGGGWMGPVYDRLGISVGVIAHDFSGIFDPSYQESPSHGDDRLDHWRPCTRREAYRADITYGTNNEFGFDYLRDNMAYRLDQTVQLRRPPEGVGAPIPTEASRNADRSVGAQASERTHHFAIVDEVDSILIDEARTPLIISAPDVESAEYYQTFSRVVPQLKENEDYNIDEKLKAVTITEQGIEKVERIIGVEDIYAEKGFRYVRYLEQALRSHALFQRDRDYVVKDGQVIIVDEFTGRLMPGRRWSEGLHQAIEAKEGVPVQRESRTLATITFQNYFRRYAKLAGMTGTAATSAEEFHKVYTMDVVSIPTNRPLVRKDMPDLILKNESGKFSAITREVKERHAKGQPVLIGTVSIAKNERLAAYLGREGVPHKVLNAKNHEEEAKIIAQAGRRGAVTIATNMAGRGVDIILWGTPPDPREAEAVCAVGGLHVIGTERHEARRTDNQLRGRAGRQGDPGSSQFFLSLEDDLMRIFGSDRIKSLMETFGIAEDQPIEHRLVTKSIESAQEKIEGFHFDARKHILEFDDVMTKQREYVYRLRREVLTSAEEDPTALLAKTEAMFREEALRIVSFHAAADDADAWNLEEIAESLRAIAEVPATVRGELARIAGQGTGAGEKREEIVRYVAETLHAILAEERAKRGDALVADAMKAVMLQSIDMLWMDHLDQMEHLRDSVRLRAYGQRDPLVEYKHEGVRLFRELQVAIRVQIVDTVFKVFPASGAHPENILRVAAPSETRGITFQSPKDELEGKAQGNAGGGLAPVYNPAPKKHEPGRNEPCPCGSGKKYKKCHGR